jgi:hypothetical protein
VVSLVREVRGKALGPADPESGLESDHPGRTVQEGPLVIPAFSIKRSDDLAWEFPLGKKSKLMPKLLVNKATIKSLRRITGNA